MTRAIDYTPLTDAVTKQQVSAFRTAMRADPSWKSSALTQGFAAGCAIIVLLGVGAATMTTVLSVASTATAQGTGSTGFVNAFVPVVFVLVIVGIVIGMLRSVFGVGQWEKWMRLSGFASANGLVYSRSTPTPVYPGAIFQQGHSRKALNHFRSASGRFLDLGNYQYVTGSGKSRQTHNWGFMALHLDRKLPHMVLDSKANNGLFGTNLPSTFRKEQALSLEGDFDKYFTLYCPREYERDALYVFTPDLMALLIDEAAPFDVEIVDDWMFVYSSRVFPVTAPATYQRLFRIVDTVGAKTLTQTDRYVDERVGTFAANVVAPQGQRLRKGVPVAAIVITGIVVAIWILPRIMDVLG